MVDITFNGTSTGGTCSANVRGGEVIDVVAKVYGLTPGTFNVIDTVTLKTSISKIEVTRDEKYVPVTIVANQPPGGLTPGYWKNWKNHYTSEQFNELLVETFVGPDIDKADQIFSAYSSKPGKELTMLKAHLLAAQLTLSLVNKPQMPNPDEAFLSPSYKIQYNGNYISIGEVINQAQTVIANPSSTRDQIIEVKDMLDLINNL